MEIVLLAIVGVVVLAAVAYGVWRGVTSPPGPPRPEPWTDGATVGRTIVLDVTVADPEDPAVQRLVREAGHHALRAEPELDEVEVRARDGTVLGRVRRPQPLRDIELPETLHEPHVAQHRGPSAVPAGRITRPTMSREDVDDEPSPRHRDFADRFELAPPIERELARRDDPVELVRAILASAGKQVEVEGDRLVVDDLAIVVLADLLDRATEALNHAFHRCAEAGVRRGLVIRLGWVNPEELRRREAAAPWIRHVDADAIQRMADAVALGADPVVFAAGPRVVA
jgi:hypothetical protein